VRRFDGYADANYNAPVRRQSRSVEMNKVVREHYPASKLPHDLRGSIASGASVTITVVEERSAKRVPMPELVRRTREIQAARSGTSIEEAVARIRALRDEWDD
jgi:hypothetical protein